MSLYTLLLTAIQVLLGLSGIAWLQVVYHDDMVRWVTVVRAERTLREAAKARLNRTVARTAAFEDTLSTRWEG